MANELTWYDAPLPYGVRMGARRPKYQGYGLPKGFPQSRLSDIDECQEMCRFSDAGNDEAGHTLGDRRRKSAEARNRGEVGTVGAVGSMGI